MKTQEDPVLHPFLKGFGVNVLLLALVLCLGAGGWSRLSIAQEKEKAQPQEQKKEQEPFKIGVEVNLVTVPVTVRKPAGGFVKGLPQSSFQILEDGEPQEIVSFAQEGVPARIAIVLDTSGSVRYEWGGIKYSTKKFIEHLKPEDKFALITFDEDARLKMDWGSNPSRVDAVLSSVYCKGNTDLWDAIWLACTEVFKGVQEKKAVIIMSDGLDNGSSVSYSAMLDAAIRSEAMIYVVSKTEAVRQSILFNMAQQRVYDDIPREIFVEADMALRKIAYETGGRVLYPNNFGQLDNIYAEVDEELRSQYTLAYVSSNKIKDGSYRRIQVAVAQSGVVVAARPGYYAPNDLPHSRLQK
jgi:Ca-activated chloride channel family protein